MSHRAGTAVPAVDRSTSRLPAPPSERGKERGKAGSKQHDDGLTFSRCFWRPSPIWQPRRPASLRQQPPPSLRRPRLCGLGPLPSCCCPRPRRLSCPFSSIARSQTVCGWALTLFVCACLFHGLVLLVSRWRTGSPVDSTRCGCSNRCQKKSAPLRWWGNVQADVIVSPSIPFVSGVREVGLL